jgi:hypothetical protein
VRAFAAAFARKQKMAFAMNAQLGQLTSTSGRGAVALRRRSHRLPCRAAAPTSGGKDTRGVSDASKANAKVPLRSKTIVHSAAASDEASSPNFLKQMLVIGDDEKHDSGRLVQDTRHETRRRPFSRSSRQPSQSIAMFTFQASCQPSLLCVVPDPAQGFGLTASYPTHVNTKPANEKT